MTFYEWLWEYEDVSIEEFNNLPAFVRLNYYSMYEDFTKSSGEGRMCTLM